MAFTIEERQILGIHGLLPAAVKTQEEQLDLCRRNLERYTDDLSKYIYLIGLLVHCGYCCITVVRSRSARGDTACRLLPSSSRRPIVRPVALVHADSDARSCFIGQKRETLLPFVVRGCSRHDAAGVHADRGSGV